MAFRGHADHPWGKILDVKKFRVRVGDFWGKKVKSTGFASGPAGAVDRRHVPAGAHRFLSPCRVNRLSI
jgi:hypothetical protein